MNKIYCQRFACVETTLLRLHTASPNIIYHYNNKFKFKFCFFAMKEIIFDLRCLKRHV